MARQNKDLTADVYGEEFSTEQLQAIRRRLAKRANNNLRDLARNSSPITGEVYNSYGAAVNALDYLKKRGRRYFSEKEMLTKNRTVLKSEILRLQKFLNAPTSTSKGQREIEEKRVATFEGKPHPVHFARNKEFYDFLNSDTFHGLVSGGLSSETVLEAYDTARLKAKGDHDATMEKLDDALQAFRSKAEESNVKNLWQHLDISPFENSGNE